MNIRLFFISLSLILLPGTAYSHTGDVPVPDESPLQHEVGGTVTDAQDGMPLPGVHVVVKGTTIGATTNVDGLYQFEVPQPNDTLVFSFIGYLSEEVPIDGRSTIDVALRPDVVQIEALVVTGYQVQRREDITGAVSTVDAEQVRNMTGANPVQELQGRVAGLQVLSDGTPGGGNAAVRIRGLSTFGDNEPLYVIDGVPTQEGLRTLNARDIESIQVLKDASAASIYGARAAHGVVVITTREGSDDLRVSFDSHVGNQVLASHVPVLNAEQWGRVYYQARRNDGIANPVHPLYTFTERADGGVDVHVPEFIDRDGLIPSADTDWFREVFSPAVEQSYNLSVARGTENANVWVSGSFFNQSGIINHTGFERLTLRINSDYHPNDRLRVGENLSISHTKEVTLFSAFTGEAITQHPLVPVYKTNGEHAGPTDGLGDRLNPVGLAWRNRHNAGRNWRIFGNAFAELDPVERLTLRSSIGLDFSNFGIRAFQPRFNEGTEQRVENELFTENAWGLDWTWTNTAEFDLLVGNHLIDLIGGVEMISEYSEVFNAMRRGFFLDHDLDFRYLSAGGGTQTNAGNATEAAIFSVFGKANYNFADRYLLSFTLRRDASSRLGRENNVGVFPAGSVGWRLSNERFMDRVDVVSDLRIRLGLGQTGGQSIGNFAAFSTYAFNPDFSAYDIGGTRSSLRPGFYRTAIGNQLLGWERSTEYNVGLNVGLWNNQVTMAADYFIKKTRDMLLQPPLLGVQGEGSPPFLNAAAVDNRGLEVDIQYGGDIGESVRFNISGNVSAIRNRVEELTGALEFMQGVDGNRIQPGHPMSAFYGWVFDGIFQNEQEVQAHADQGFASPSDGVGRMRFRDLNGDGVITDADRTFIGNPHPDFVYGLNLDLNYRQFDLTFFLQGEQGRDIFNATRRLTDFAFWNFNFGENTLNAWSPENPNTDIPRLSSQNRNDEQRVSSYYVEDGSYLRLKRLTLGYSLPERLNRRIGLQNARLYVQATDLITLTGYSGNDPELGVRNPFNMGIDFNFHPHPRKITAGMNLNF